MKTFTSILTIALAAICTTGYAQNNDSAVSDTTPNTALGDEEDVYFVPQIFPEFPGGVSALTKFVAKNLDYPEEAKSQKIEGKVWIRFVVNKTGDVENVEVLRGVDPLLDSEAVRLVQSMPKWEPAKQRGKPVDCPFTIPIMFSLEKAKKH